MPPAAATECDRTGWTLLMIATVAPASAAARAARWPARPAPMMRTSCAGMALSKRRGESNSSTGRGGRALRPSARLARSGGARGGLGEGAADLVDGHDAAQPVL